jgi:cobalt transporter subunit CbtA
MFRRAFLAAVLAGAVAGLVMSLVQHYRVTPFIFAAEVFENATPSHDATSHDHGTSAEVATTGAEKPAEWQPEDGFERTAYTVLANLVVGIGFGLALAGASLLLGIPVTVGNGAVWGLCAFIAVSIAPAAGLPPELPGMAAAEITIRQIWWWFTVGCTAAGIGMIARTRNYGLWALGAVIIALPHLIGAPDAPHEATNVPAHLATGFAANALAAAAIFWTVLGITLGFVNERSNRDATT